MKLTVRAYFTGYFTMILPSHILREGGAGAYCELKRPFSMKNEITYHMWGYYPLKYMPSYSLNVLAIYSRIEAHIPYDEIGIYDIE